MKQFAYTTLQVCIIALFFSAAGSLSVSAHEFRGKIRNAVDQSAVINATVMLETGKSKYSIPSDDAGRFQITGQDDDSIIVTVSCLGFATARNIVLRSQEENLVELVPTTITLGSLVVTAKRYEKNAYKVSQPIAALSGEELTQNGTTTIPSALQQFPGVDITDAGPFRARPVIRGLYGNRILVLVDGERLNDFRESNNFAGVSLSLVDANEVERVEVVNGPTSVLYGSDAMGGVVNIITKRNSFTPTLKPVASYRGQYSSANDLSSNRFDLGFSSDQFSGQIGYQYREANTEYQPPDGWNSNPHFSVYHPSFYDSLNAERGTNFTNERLVNSRARINNYDGKLAFKIDQNNRLDADLGYFRGNDIGYPGVPNAATPYFFFYPEHKRQNVSVSYSGRNLTSRMARLDSRLFYQRIDKEFYTDFLESIVIPLGPPGSPTLTPLTVLNTTEVTKLGWNFQELYNLSKATAFAFGFDLLRESIEGDNVERSRMDGAGPQPIYDEQTSSPVPPNDWISVGFFGSVETEIGKLQTTISGRYDNFWIATEKSDLYVDDEGNELPATDERYASVNGSLGLVYPLSPKVNLLANLGTGYRVPNVIEQFYYGSASGRETRPNADLDPEQSVTVDLGVKGVHREFDYSLIGFVSRFDNFIQFAKFDSVPQGPGRYEILWRHENFEQVTIAGFEASIQMQLENGLYSTLGFTYQHGTLNSENDEPLFVSPIRTTATLGYRHRSGLFSECTIRRTEKQDRIPKVAYLDDVATREFTVVDASFGLKLWQKVSLTLSGMNLFDELYAEPFNARVPDNPIPEPGRHFVISLSSSL